MRHPVMPVTEANNIDWHALHMRDALAPHPPRHDMLPRPLVLVTLNARASPLPDATRKFYSASCLRVGADLARGLIAVYRLTLSPVIGNNCRHLPTCSQYADEAIGRHGLWAGGWMTLARLSRCHPFGTSGLDFVAHELPADVRWYLPWRYGRWRGVNDHRG
jgi:uncharacterized protein